MQKFDVVVAGEINPDLILSDLDLTVGFGQQEALVESAALTIGSSSAIFACGAARLGLKVAFIGVVGDDMFGRFMLDALRARGIDVSGVIVDSDEQTGLSVILSRGTDRAILTHSGAIGALRAEMVTDEMLQAANHIHVASFFLQTNLQTGLADLFKRARSLGLSTSLDANWDPSGEWSGLDEILPVTDIFFPNAVEAQSLTGATTLEYALAMLSQKVPFVAIKLGANGAIARRGNEIARAPALAVLVADTVGAGDSFDAGFVYSYLQDWPLERCLRLAVTCGSLSVRLAGGTDAQPNLEEALRFMKK